MSNPNLMASILGGGACNPDGTQMSHSSNPYRNFLQNFFLGKGNVRQKMGGGFQSNEGFFPGMQEAMPPEHFDQAWAEMSKEFNQMNISKHDMQKIMEEEWKAEQFRRQEMERRAIFEQKRAWEDAQRNQERIHKEQLALENHMANQWRDAEMHREAKDWGKDFMADPENMGLDKEFEDAFLKAQEEVYKSQDETKVIKDSANYMVDVMQNDPDPRFQNSKLLHFLKKLHTGDYEIKDNQLIKNNDTEGFEEAWGEAKTEYKMNKVWEQEEHKIDARAGEPEEDTEKVFDKIWKKFQAGEMEAPEEALEEEYKKILEQMETMDKGGNMEDIFADMWNVEQDVEEYHAYGDVPEAYKFNIENPFANNPKSLEIASNMLNSGNTRNAILALESHLQQHPEDSNSWRVLGKMHMDNDQDRPAVRCFLNSVNLDPKNLDNLLALGISCTNILDEVQAMNHLKHWMMNNPKYANIITDPEVIPENMTGRNLTTEDVRNMNSRLLERFEAAKAMNPTDPELNTCLAVLYFVARDYKASVHLFNEALQHDPNNYSLWNKLGATLAHLGRAEEAVEAYNRALEFKPNYVRTWVNLGIAHAYKGEFDDAARFYLSALSMNPNAQHVWSYLQTTLLSLQRYDLLKLIAERDLEGFKKEFDIVLPEELPPPEIEYKLLNEQFLVKEKSENWLKEFNQSN